MCSLTSAYSLALDLACTGFKAACILGELRRQGYTLDHAMLAVRELIHAGAVRN